MNARSKAIGSTAGILLSFCSTAILSQSSSSQSASPDGPDKQETSFYTVSKYDPQRNPAKDLEAAVKRAKAEGKRIILEIGGHW